jgi:hypothetical protein
MSLDRRIFKAIKGHSETHPQDLVSILAYIDSQEKLVLTHEELSGGLQRLIESGQIAEAIPHKYFDTVGQSHSRAFSGISLQDHEEACQAYLKLFSEQDREVQNERPSEDDFTRQKIVIRWKLKGDEYPTDADEDAAEALTKKVDSILRQNQRAEINGFEFGPGCIDILIFGKETDDDTDAIYGDILATFRVFGCPPGSCIVRQYEDRDEEVISDIVPDESVTKPPPN